MGPAHVPDVSGALDAEARYRLLAENASDLVGQITVDGVITWISPSCDWVLGLPAEEAVGRSMVDFAHPEERDIYADGLARVAAGERGTFEHRFRHADGSWRWMSTVAQPVLDDDGRVVAIIGSSHDISEQVGERRERERLHEMFQVLAENSSDFVMLMSADGRVKWSPEASAAALGYTPEEIVGRRASEWVHPDDAEAIRTGAAAVAAGEAARARVRIKVADGTYRWHSVVSRPVHDPVTGEVTDRVTSFQDAQELVASEHRFRLLAENSADVILLTDTDTRLFWVSPASTSMLGWAPEELIGHCAHEFIHPDDWPEVQERIRHSAESGADVHHHYRWRRPDGTYRWMDAAGHPFDDDGEGRPGRVVRLRDVQSDVESREALDLKSRTDELTGLVNRGEGMARLGHLLRAQQLGSGTLAIAFCDLDDFKSVNDTFGHSVGDDVLKRVAARIRAVVREADTVARLGGDEFVVLLPGAHDLDAVTAVAEKIRRAVEEPLPYDANTPIATVSIGVVMAESGDDVDALIRRADRAMYFAKQAGRNRVFALD